MREDTYCVLSIQDRIRILQLKITFDKKSCRCMDIEERLKVAFL